MPTENKLKKWIDSLSHPRYEIGDDEDKIEVLEEEKEKKRQKTLINTRRKQGPGFYQGDIGEDK